MEGGTCMQVPIKPEYHARYQPDTHELNDHLNTTAEVGSILTMS